MEVRTSIIKHKEILGRQAQYSDDYDLGPQDSFSLICANEKGRVLIQYRNGQLDICRIKNTNQPEHVSSHMVYNVESVIEDGWDWEIENSHSTITWHAPTESNFVFTDCRTKKYNPEKSSEQEYSGGGIDVKKVIKEAGKDNIIYVDAENKDAGYPTFRLLHLIEKETGAKIKKIYLSSDLLDALYHKRNKECPFWIKPQNHEIKDLWGVPFEVQDGITAEYEDQGMWLPRAHYKTKEVLLFELESGRWILGAV